MLAFTFPGQGSQRPGMGRPWASEESWELVGEASEIAERDLERLLLDADADELKDTRNAQLATFVLEPRRARRDRAPRPRCDVLRGPQPRRVHRARRHRRARRSTRASQLVAERGEAMHDRWTRIGPARWPRSSGSTTTRSRSRAAGPTATCGSRTTTRPARSSSPGRPKASRRLPRAPRSSARRRCCRSR